MTRPDRTIALIVAAGAGARAGGDIPKQYRALAGKAVLAHAIDALAGHRGIDAVQVVIGAGQEQLYEAAVGDRPLLPPVIGGRERRDSVRHGLEAIAAAGGVDIVLIHDAARLFCPPDVIDRLLAALDDNAGAVPALAVIDSVARGGDLLGDPVERSGLVRVQTPQAFGFDAILAAHREWDDVMTATDDAQVARAAGIDVALVEGDARLDKLTHAGDFARMGFAPTIRTGMGFDVHAFAPGDAIRLGGIDIAHGKALAGHSDADVALHAITDAILGAIVAGDIGDHFPPGDPRWRGADSAVFLAHAGGLAAQAGFAIGHLDVTIICEAPRIGPHRLAMRRRIAEILGVTEAAVSVKATTTERLGFLGRGEGIAAQAVVTVHQRPPG